jgi:serine/threonine protein kinase
MGGNQSSPVVSGGNTPVSHLGTRKSLQRKLDDEYFIQKVQLGTGSFGVVRRAIHKPTQEDRAVKSIDKRRVEIKPNYRQHLQREIEIMRECFGHKNIVKLYDWFEDELNIHLVLEYCGGGDFGDRILQCRATMTESQACEWFHQILQAVDVLHSKGVCHRDIKPENFLISTTGPPGQKVMLKLSDFGLAIRVTTPLRELAGTPAYQGPEIHNLNNLPASTGTDFSSSGYGLPVDLWACGVTLFVILSGGKNPFVNGQTNKLLLNDIRSGTIKFDDLMITYPEGSDSGTKTKNRFFSSSTAAAAAGRTKPHNNSNAEQLLRLLLTVDPSRRLTVGDALRHPWFVQHGLASPPPSSPLSAVNNAAMNRSPVSIDSGSLEASPPTMEPILIAPRRATSFELHIEEDADAILPLSVKRRESAGVMPASAVTIGPGGSKDGKVVRCAKCGSFFYSQRGQATACPECRVQLGFSLPPDSVNTGCVVYHSVNGKWVRGTVSRFIEQTGEFELDDGVRVGGTAVAPPGKDVGPGPAWPKGTSVVYQSATYGTWLPATIEAFSSNTRTYDLDVKNGVGADRIRARVKRLTQ